MEKKSMIRVLRGRTSQQGHAVRMTEVVARDPSARFAYDFATTSPTKDVASVKAASDVYDANLRPSGATDERRSGKPSIKETY